MKMNRLILVVIVLSAVVDAHYELKNIKSVNSDSIKDELSETSEALNLKESQLINIKSFLSQINGEYQANKANVKNNEDNSDKARVINVDSKSFDLRLHEEATSDEEKELFDSVISSATETSEQNDESNKEYELSDADGNIARRKEILDYLTKILNKNRDEEVIKANHRLNIEGKYGGLPDLVEIDSERLRDFNQDDGFKATRRFMGYGARLDMKGRSGATFGEGSMANSPVDRGLPINAQNDRVLYRPSIPSRRMFFSPGFFRFVATSPPAPPITVTKINRQELLQPTNDAPVRVESRRRDSMQDQLNAESAGDATSHPNSNAYAYEPENETVNRLVDASKDATMKGIQNSLGYGPAHRYLKRDLWPSLY